MILYYQIKYGKTHSASKLSPYITVNPVEALSNFDLKGLSPEMFCMNLADMVNMQGLFKGNIENEHQSPVAHWTMSQDEYLEAIRQTGKTLSHQQIVPILSSMPDYVRESNNQYIDFEACAITHAKSDNKTCSGYKLTIMTEDLDGEIHSYAYFNFDTRSEAGWLNLIPPSSEIEELQNAVNRKLQSIKEAGVEIARIYDETDYVLTK